MGTEPGTLQRWQTGVETQYCFTTRCCKVSTLQKDPALSALGKVIVQFLKKQQKQNIFQSFSLSFLVLKLFPLYILLVDRLLTEGF